jgi:hypothetical protein
MNPERFANVLQSSIGVRRQILDGFYGGGSLSPGQRAALATTLGRVILSDADRAAIELAVRAQTPKLSPAVRRTQHIQTDAAAPWGAARETTLAAMELCRAAAREDLINRAIMLSAVDGANLDGIKAMIADANWDRAVTAARAGRRFA